MLWALAWLSGCASHAEVIPIIHVSPGADERLMLRPPGGSVLTPPPSEPVAEPTTPAPPESDEQLPTDTLRNQRQRGCVLDETERLLL